MSRELVSPQLHDAVRSLPSDAVKDLLSIGVCVRCTFRIFGIRGSVFLNHSLSPAVILSIIGEPTDTDNSTLREGLEDAGPEICPVCLGVLQFFFCDEKDTLVRMQGAEDFAASVFGMVKKEGHSIDGFSLEVSLPQIISDNEQGVRSYMKSKYDSQHWFKQMLSAFMSTKDALKFMITTSLETLLDVKSGPGSICIRLTYSQAKPSTMVPTSKRNGSCKRLKTGNNNDLSSINDDLVGASSESVSLSAAERHVICQESSSGLEACETFQCFRFPAEKTNEPCHLALLCYRSPVYFVGRYLKFSRNVSQTRWMIDDERMGEASVEEIIGGNILPICRGDAYKFHAAGREDIDVRMLGSGRPFLVEIQNPRQVLNEDAIKEIETKINNLENKLVGVKNLKVAASEGWTLMHEGEAEKQKQYCALVWISRPLEDQDLLSITSFKDMLVSQKTPIRVLHRRSPLEREKTIHWMKIEKIAGSSQYFLLHLCTQAGTYIKEFVHGDLGRTHPCIGSILGCRAEILQLDVTDVKMDCFPPE